MPKLTIDERTVEFQPGQTILEVARGAGIEIPTLCYLPGRPANTSCFLCVVRVNGGARLLPSCATIAADGMAVESESAEVLDARRTAIELLLSDHLGDCIGPCRGVCPAHMDMPRMIRQIAAGQVREALITVKDRIALPAVLGRICPELCEKGCRRGPRDGPVSVCMLKRYVADADIDSGAPWLPACKPDSGKRVAIVGAGPAGLAAAWYLRQDGHACTLLDDHERPGGALRYAVPEDLLPRDVLDAEIGVIERLGVEWRLGVRLGDGVSLDGLRQEFDAVLLATGPVPKEAAAGLGVPLAGQGLRVDRRTLMTPVEGVFAAGACLQPSRHAVRAVADGRAAAISIDRYLRGLGPGVAEKEWSVHVGRLDAAEAEPFVQGANQEPRVAPAGGPSAGLTPDEALREARRCLGCDCRKPDDCKLRQYAVAYDANPLRFRGPRRSFERDATHPAVVYESGKCIACGICVQIAAGSAEELGLTFIGRGFSVRTAVPFDQGLADGLRRTALACAEACPTGALTKRDG